VITVLVVLGAAISLPVAAVAVITAASERHRRGVDRCTCTDHRS
jgi:hypothetical protein